MKFHSWCTVKISRRTQTFLVVISSLLLLILGMRVPELSQNRMPKPRPRSVVGVPGTGQESVGTQTVISDDAVPGSPVMVHRICPVYRQRHQDRKRPLLVFSDQDVARGPP